MSECLSCKNAFVQPFVCTTCGAEKLYDATLKTAQDQAALWEADLFEANARIAELEAECAELRVDAERYRWLRKQGKPTSPESIWFARGVFGFGGISLWCLDRLDEAIDEAMKKTTI